MNGAQHAFFQVSSSPSTGGAWEVGVSVYFRDPAGQDKVWTTYVRDMDRDTAITVAREAIENDIRRTALFSTSDWATFENDVNGLMHHSFSSWSSLTFIWSSNLFANTGMSGQIGSSNDPITEIQALSQPIPPGMSKTPTLGNTLQGHAHTGSAGVGQKTGPASPDPDPKAHMGADASDDLLDLVTF